ncbi:hypothetical protein FEM48_Zijuj10G0132900 [Ziziphus jujuba var. spinosa]|uniref:Uncharacterized protein n=1 Tax=Ziziphus jujuba var. spinosa TaxID=714518 RepID=A0A978UNL3_ZIZJJ|nr:hypothetical protein FEM48_Zijuj10G0132900 [Ziziphus jujuba var. spinosa]
MVTLIGLLQLMYEAKNVSPFDTHYTTMVLFFVSLFVYVIAATVDKELPQPQNPNYTGIMSKTKLFSGCFALNMLLLILIPPFGWFILTLCIAYFVKEDEAHDVFDGRRGDRKADVTRRCFVAPWASGGAPASSSFGPVMNRQYGAFGAVTLD